MTDSYDYLDGQANGFGEMLGYTASANGNEVFKTVFERDKLGRITKKTETLNGSTNSTQYEYEYTYEVSPGVTKDAGRLQKVITTPVINGVPDTNNSTSATYSYDANSNRLNNGAVYDDQDRLTSTSTASYTYTENGELLTKTVGTDVTTYDYDVLGNLRSVDLPNTNDDIEYLIDGRNRRIGRKVDGVLEQQWLYKDQLNPVAELDGNGKITKCFIYASRANIPDIVVDVSGTSPVVYRIVSDHLGSPRFIINTADGTKALKFEYDEWGNETYQVFVPGIDRNLIPFGFAGGLYDEDTGLVRFGARDYDPEIGRWTSKDPLRFFGDGLNLYGYVLNSPINFADYFGLRITIIGDPSFKITIRKIIERIRSTKVGKDLVECLEASSINFKIKDVSGSGLGNEFDFPSNTIRIDPRLRPFYRTKDGGIARMSLERIVAHEMGHASGYGSRLEEEERIVRDIENPITKEFGERERGGYELVPKF